MRNSGLRRPFRRKGNARYGNLTDRYTVTRVWHSKLYFSNPLIEGSKLHIIIVRSGLAERVLAVRKLAGNRVAFRGAKRCVLRA